MPLGGNDNPNLDNPGGLLSPTGQQQVTQAAQAAHNATPATAAETHNMFVATAILLAVGMLLVLFAGESHEAGNAIIMALVLLLFLQALLHVNPFIQWLANHPLTPPGS